VAFLKLSFMEVRLSEQPPQLWPFMCTAMHDDNEKEAALATTTYWQNHFARLYPMCILRWTIAFPLIWLVGGPTKPNLDTHLYDILQNEEFLIEELGYSSTE
jgi:hypothetical protein